MPRKPEYTAILSYQAKPGKAHKFLYSGATIRIIEHSGSKAKLYNCHFIKTKPHPFHPKGFWAFHSGDPGARELATKFDLAGEVTKRQGTGKALTSTRPAAGLRFIRFVPKVAKKQKIIKYPQTTLVSMTSKRRKRK
jgi:hypothetical protein